jgi:retron-type reverse transcriptase
LEENIFQLHRDLKNKTYRHGPYKGFYIRDPKQRHIHKATVIDRILHHAVFSVINPIFEPTFISNSFSCRIGHGTHKGVNVLKKITQKVSRNNTHRCFVLKCDVQKFFASIDHETLLSIFGKRVKDDDAMWLLKAIIESYKTETDEKSIKIRPKGVPIGNLTSQLFANAYMNEFDQFIKHVLRVRHYVRYTDDFAITSDSPEYLKNLLPLISEFLKNKLFVNLYPNKIILSSICQGVDFLGYVIFPKYKLIRSKTRHRMFKKLEKRIDEYRLGNINKSSVEQSIQSYLGVLSHANTHKIQTKLLNKFWIF